MKVDSKRLQKIAQLLEKDEELKGIKLPKIQNLSNETNVQNYFQEIISIIMAFKKTNMLKYFQIPYNLQKKIKSFLLSHENCVPIQYGQLTTCIRIFATPTKLSGYIITNIFISTHKTFCHLVLNVVRFNVLFPNLEMYCHQNQEQFVSAHYKCRFALASAKYLSTHGKRKFGFYIESVGSVSFSAESRKTTKEWIMSILKCCKRNGINMKVLHLKQTYDTYIYALNAWCRMKIMKIKNDKITIKYYTLKNHPKRKLNVDDLQFGINIDFIRSKTDQCSFCSRNDCVLFRCKNCAVQKYCSKSCQKRDWIRHRSFCQKFDVTNI